ncbi:peptidylprolyl isomerase [Actinokineospora bangkokensis]|uniref:PPIase cyclophilin-type domain-containing protein n=1 Tax=Actinokineospora bangkokensis TaxID=1193682 RepID=A0A1Q9LS87_9PSEU|nr:peptidylprolyl isomerase [Actinokineospora bangkokensis]OLR94879.1 hypothetical protein BJP25_09685 [Actinokineospora bangkokensis]
MRPLPALAALAAAALLLSGCASAVRGTAVAGEVPPSTAPRTTTSAQASTSAPGASGAGVSCDYERSGTAAKPVDLPPATSTDTPAKVVLALGGGEVIVELSPDTPCTGRSFAHLARSGYYDGTPCHRLTTSAGLQVLQCGDPSGTGSGGPGYVIPDENPDSASAYVPGVVAMANAGPHTGGSQFFIIYGTCDIPPDYAVIGKTDAAGLAVVTRIAAGGVDSPSGDGPPKTPVTIESAKAS